MFSDVSFHQKKFLIMTQYCFSNHVRSLAGIRKTWWTGFNVVRAAICRKNTFYGIDAANKTETIVFVGTQSLKMNTRVSLSSCSASAMNRESF